MCVVDGARTGSQHPDRQVAHFPAMTVGTVEKVQSPPFSYAGYLGKLVRCSGREEEAPCLDGLTAVEPDRESGLDRVNLVCDEFDAVAAGLVTCACEQLGRRHPVAREE